ncbi:glycosyltransferase family 4 protein [Herpetosiphon llansteffanensis]|uniref:glycosyltransferase family 4 protein n=1 Tax=Herpetosiphon llansteffanensis TaxID=2094568 RepID=UPI0013E08A07|nr:glycosyltransferase family 4 protein [Herpetosiphon llansteffanensis]
MNDTLHVAMIIQGYFPRIGGAERQLAALAPFLAAEGVAISVLTRRYAGFKPFEMIDNVPVHRLPIPGPVPTAALVFTAAAIPLLWRLKPNLVHAHEMFSPATTAIAAKQALGLPYAVTAHRSGPLGDVLRMQQRPFGKGRLERITKTADAFFTISREIDHEFDQILGIEAERRHYVPNGVDPEKYHPISTEAKIALRRELNLPSEGPITLYAGRLSEEKRVRYLVEAWPAVRAKHPDASLLILGQGPEEAALKAKSSAGVIFGGAVHNVPPYLQAADVFVLPSIAEGFSVAMLEAMASELAVIITDVGGARDAINDGQNGLIIPPDDQPALEQALLAVLGNAAARQRMGQTARQRVQQEFALSVIAKRLRSLYEGVAKG